MKWALLIDGVVDTVTMAGPEEGWVEVPDDVFGGFIQNPDGTFSAPELPPVHDPFAGRAERKAEIAEMIANGQTADALNALMVLLPG